MLDRFFFFSKFLFGSIKSRILKRFLPYMIHVLYSIYFMAVSIVIWLLAICNIIGTATDVAVVVVADARRIDGIADTSADTVAVQLFQNI